MFMTYESKACSNHGQTLTSISKDAVTKADLNRRRAFGLEHRTIAALEFEIF